MSSVWPKTPPRWLAPWILWRLAGAHGKAPIGTPRPLPEYAGAVLSFCEWRIAGGRSMSRPWNLPKPIPAWAWPIATRATLARKPPPPRPRPGADPIWRSPTAWINDPHSAPWDAIERYVRELGYRNVVVPLLGGTRRRDDFDRVAFELKRYQERLGVRVIGDQWIVAEERMADQAGALEAVCAELRLDAAVANGEKVLDGVDSRGEWSDAAFCRSRAWLSGWPGRIPIAVSTEGRTAMDHAAWRERRACLMTQAYYAENGFDVRTVGEFAIAQGWSPLDLNVLVQAHLTAGKPEVDYLEMRRQAVELGLGALTIYPGEAALDRPYAWERLSYAAA